VWIDKEGRRTKVADTMPHLPDDNPFMTLGVGVSRIYLGVHHRSDVVGAASGTYPTSSSTISLRRAPIATPYLSSGLHHSPSPYLS
jgi:hypothetical protein